MNFVNQSGKDIAIFANNLLENIINFNKWLFKKNRCYINGLWKKHEFHQKIMKILIQLYRKIVKAYFEICQSADEKYIKFQQLKCKNANFIKHFQKLSKILLINHGRKCKFYDVFSSKAISIVIALEQKYNKTCLGNHQEQNLLHWAIKLCD